MDIAVIGAGISGLSCAWRLRGGGVAVPGSRAPNVTVYEANDYAGGHTRTVNVEVDGFWHPVDTGFLVFNERTYPQLIELFRTLAVKTVASEMTFSVHVDRGAKTPIEWAGTDLDAVFAQRRNLVRPRFLQMLADLLRFNRAATVMARESAPALSTWTLGEYLDAHRYSRAFTDWYLLPMAAAIWSCSTTQMRDFPLQTFVRFCANHGLLQVADRPQWYTVVDGARCYVERLLDTLPDVRLATPARSVVRVGGAHGTKVAVRTDAGTALYDHVVLASHSDQSLALLEDADGDEREVLAAVRYQPNHAILHTDAALLPRDRRAWAAWNYRSDGVADSAAHSAAHSVAHSAADDERSVSVHYLINKLQPLPFRTPVIVSLNPGTRPRDETILGEFDYSHPLFDARAIQAQRRLPALQGRRQVWFAGAWTGYGFHEDGLRSGLAVADAIALAAAGTTEAQVRLAA